MFQGHDFTKKQQPGISSLNNKIQDSGNKAKESIELIHSCTCIHF